MYSKLRNSKLGITKVEFFYNSVVSNSSYLLQSKKSSAVFSSSKKKKQISKKLIIHEDTFCWVENINFILLFREIKEKFYSQ